MGEFVSCCGSQGPQQCAPRAAWGWPLSRQGRVWHQRCCARTARNLPACTALPLFFYPAGLTPAQLTAANMDRSNQLVAAAALHWGGDVRGLVGEMQFAFVAFVFGQSLQGEGGRPREEGRGGGGYMH